MGSENFITHGSDFQRQAKPSVLAGIFQRRIDVLADGDVIRLLSFSGSAWERERTDWEARPTFLATNRLNQQQIQIDLPEFHIGLTQPGDNLVDAVTILLHLRILSGPSARSGFSHFRWNEQRRSGQDWN